MATTSGRPGGKSLTSPGTTSMSDSRAMASVMNRANRSRSTASASPAGTRVSSAATSTAEPRRRISSLRRPTAFSGLLERSELEQTSSERASLV